MNNLSQIIAAFKVIEKDLKLVFPIHPRTRKNIENNGLKAQIDAMKNLILLEPVGYLDFLKMTANAALVMTDSGGIQEETTILQVPCMTLRENTERPVTVSEGTNRLIHIDAADILKNYNEIKANNFITNGRIPKFWDGKAADRIAAVLRAQTVI
jgi:UDP-N-acetylglucosamine 2-epimerase (non-hydrolysing)